MQSQTERLPFEGIGERIRGLLASAALEKHQAELLRQRIADAIEELIGLLDEAEAPDEDLEPDDEGQCAPHTLRFISEGCGAGTYDPTDADVEPTLGWPEGMSQKELRRGGPVGIWGYQDGEMEPSLGSLGGCWNGRSQTQWSLGWHDDREDEHDGAEPHEDGIEPSLCGVSYSLAVTFSDHGQDLEDDGDSEPDDRDLDPLSDPDAPPRRPARERLPGTADTAPDVRHALHMIRVRKRLARLAEEVRP